MSVILSPDILAEVMVGVMVGDSIVDGGNDSEKPGEGCQNLVSPNRLCIVRLSAREWVICHESARSVV